MDGTLSASQNRKGRFTIWAALVLLGVSCLTLLGLVALFSASHSIYNDDYIFLRKQLVWIVISLVFAFGTFIISVETLRKYVWLLCALIIIGLILTLIPGIGITVNGAQRWIGFDGLRVQVSEFSKPILVLALAHYLAVNQRHIDLFFKGFLYPCSMIGLVCGLIILQPDYGTAVLCGVVGFGLIFLSGVRLIYLVPTVMSSLGLFALMVYNNPVRLSRITSFLNIEENLSTGAYQLWQGILAFGTGGINGVGLGNGRQQFSFLPEAHTDFIFAIIGEEMGLIITLLVLFLFLSIFIIGMVQLRRAPNLYHFLLGAGALLFIILQSIINIGVVTGCLPTKGMSLPFISYGGSNLVVMFILIGLVLNLFEKWARPVISNAREITVIKD
ncbi:MAG: cell division protein FtsW [Opitutae bacterium]|nr:cell division protein FtsW [Opitutae bacterium]MBT7852753.1 cell division protein FtsW [Opitutae bacterium]